jgi:hypothetical protein
MTHELTQDAGRIVSSMALTVLDTEEALTRFRNCLVRTVAGYKLPAAGILEDTRFRAAVFPLAVRDGEVLEDVNPIWAHPGFILPGVVALARLYDAVLSPAGEPSFQFAQASDKETLYGMRLEDITPLATYDRARFAAMVSGAAKSFLTDVDQCQLARWALTEYGKT